MAKAAKKKKAKSKQTEIPLTGVGVEALHIKAIEDAADAFVEHHETREEAQEAEEDAQKALRTAMEEHESELIKDEKGRPTYRYGEKLITLKATGGVKAVVKTVHDKVAGGEEE